MTKQPSGIPIALVLTTVAFCACGTDPYVGDSMPPDASTTTRTYTTTDTVTTTIAGSSGGTSLVTGTQTATETSPQTPPLMGTETSTSSSTSPTTLTTTTIVTVTVTETSTIVTSTKQDIDISLAPARALDLVFMIDNSPSMAPKVAKLNAQFPRLINALKDPSDGTLPDLRVAVIDSDLGTAGAYSNNSCASKTLPDGTTSIFGDLGRFQMLKDVSPCTFNDGALFLEHKAGLPVNYTGDINAVFACLASNLGTMGCGMEHQLQAFEFALSAKGIGNETQQETFFSGRGNANLGLVFLSDEDDCSAATNDRLFGDLPELRGESASLRCATRAHQCSGENLSTTGPGYPTQASFAAPFATCKARMGDECGGDVDTSQPTTCNPLKSVKSLADEIKSLKADPDAQILVAGIFGWPLSDADMATAQYKIAPVPNPNAADVLHPTVYDYWPVCYDPDHLPIHPDPSTGFDVEAAGWGATGGLRESAFVDQFGANGMKLSICERDYSASMKQIGDQIARKLQRLCIDYTLFDADLSTPGVQAECRAALRVPVQDPNDPTKLIYEELPELLPQCEVGATDGTVLTNCWRLGSNDQRCPVNGQFVEVLRTIQEIMKAPQLSPGTKLHLSCHTCPTDSTELGCLH